jgi:hypothetical protein
MIPYGSRKCHCNGKASRARAELLPAKEVREELSWTASDELWLDWEWHELLNEDPETNELYVIHMIDEWANCQCACCSGPGEEEVA